VTGATASPAVAAPAWLTGFYARVDALDTEAVLAGFARDATMRYGSGEPMRGSDAIRAGLTWLFTHYRRIGHEFLGVWESASTVLVEATVTYGTADGREIAVPALTVIEHRDGLIDDLRIYLDPTPMGGT
jgi:ketosteroid isomerase-like protein